MLENSIAESLVLLGLDSNKKSEVYRYIAPGIFIELFIENKIALDNKKKVILVSDNFLGIKYKDEIISNISKSKPKKLDEWLMEFSSLDSKYKRLLQSLIEKFHNSGVIVSETKKSLIVFNKVSYNVDKVKVDEIVTSIKNGLFSNELTDEKIMSLVMLLKEMNLLTTYFSKSEVKEIKEKIKFFTHSENGAEINVIKNIVEVINILPLMGSIGAV